eukprot:scaffold78023_cov54-Phaeocystis_antarctica.AAC.2
MVVTDMGRYIALSAGEPLSLYRGDRTAWHMEGVILPRARTRRKRRLSFGAISSTCSRKKSSPMSSTPGVLPRERLRIASATFSSQTRLAV